MSSRGWGGLCKKSFCIFRKIGNRLFLYLIMKILQIEHSESNEFLDCWTWSKTFILFFNIREFKNVVFYAAFR